MYAQTHINLLQLGGVLQLPLAIQVTVADPDRMYTSLQ